METTAVRARNGKPETSEGDPQLPTATTNDLTCTLYCTVIYNIYIYNQLLRPGSEAYLGIPGARAMIIGLLIMMCRRLRLQRHTVHPHPQIALRSRDTSCKQQKKVPMRPNLS